MRALLLILLLFNIGIISGQETIRIVTFFDNSEQIMEEYEVLKNNEAVKQGMYVQYYLTDNEDFLSKKENYIKKRGYYYNNFPDDLWEYYAMKQSNSNSKVGEEYYHRSKQFAGEDYASQVGRKY